MKNEIANNGNSNNSFQNVKANNITINSNNQQIEIIRTIYADLEELNSSVWMLVTAGKGDSTEQNRVDKTYKVYYKLNKYVKQNIISFSTEFSELLLH